MADERILLAALTPAESGSSFMDHSGPLTMEQAATLSHPLSRAASGAKGQSPSLSRTASGTPHISVPASRATSVAPDYLRDPHHDSKKPIFHVMPRSGWSSDPHGALFWKGRYHLFYQHRLQTCQWHWGLCWNHVVSTDLVHWERLPPALVPTPGGYDADGCFSGSVTIDPKTGYPVMFYTGARLRENPEVKANISPVPEEYDLRMEHVETQCAAVPEDPENDELLIKWKKIPAPWMQYPHTNKLTAWRDPICIDEADAALPTPPGVPPEHMMVVCSGYKDVGAAVLIYRSDNLMQGWRYDGDLASWPDLQLGKCWECPILGKLRPLPLNHHTLTTLNTPALAPPEIDGAGAQTVAVATGGAASTISAANSLGPVSAEKADSLSSRMAQAFANAIAAVTGSGEGVHQSRPGSEGGNGHLTPHLGSAQHSIGGQWVAYPEVDPEGTGRVGALGATNQIEVMVTATTTAVIRSDGLGQVKEVSYNEAEPEEAAAAVLSAAGGEGLTSRRRTSLAMTPSVIAAAQAATADFVAAGGDITDFGAPQTPAGNLAPPEHYPGCFPPDESARWFFSISPDACTYSIIYFMGNYTRNHFDLNNAHGPYKLDLGNVLYAPTCYNDPKGRHILWGYMRELRSVPPPPCMCETFSYAGCVSLPRVLWIKGDRLFQAPLPEMVSLRTDVSWHGANLQLAPESPIPLPGVTGVHLDMEFSFRPGTAERTSIVLKSFRPGGTGALALMFDWKTKNLEVIYDVFEKPRKWHRVYGREQGVSHGAVPDKPRAPASAGARRMSLPPLPEGVDSGVLAAIEARTQASRARRSSLPPLPEWYAAQLSDGQADGVSAAAADAIAPAAPAAALTPEVVAAAAAVVTGSKKPAKPALGGLDGSRSIGATNSQGTGSSRAYYNDPEDDLDLEPIDLYDLNPDINPELRMKRKEAGGMLDMADGEPLDLRIFLDGSALEVFTGTGEVLSTRVYRGHPPAGCTNAGIELVSVGGTCEVTQVAAYEVGCCWLHEEENPLEQDEITMTAANGGPAHA